MNSISYLTRGEGKDLIFFHGYGASKECFLRQIDYFSRSFKVTAFDFSGFGQSGKLKYPYSLKDYADETLEFMRDRGIVKPHLIAHSFGVRVAIKICESENAFDKMLLTGAAGVITNRNLAYKLKVLSYRTVRKLFPLYAERRFGSEEYKKLSPIMKESYKKIVNEDLRNIAPLIESEVLLLNGEKDRTTPLKQIKIYNERIKNSKLKILKNCGHFAFLDDGFEFNLIAEEFFK